MSRSDFELGRFGGVCALTGEAIAPGAPFVAAMVEQDLADLPPFARVDVSVQAWDEGRRPDRLLAFWRTTAPEPGQKRQAFIDDETLLDMVRRMDDADPRRARYRWLLALILLRKRALRHLRIDQGPDGERWLFMPRGADEWTEPIAVANPGLRDDEVQDLADQLGEVLRSEA